MNNNNNDSSTRKEGGGDDALLVSSSLKPCALMRSTSMEDHPKAKTTTNTTCPPSPSSPLMATTKKKDNKTSSSLVHRLSSPSSTAATKQNNEQKEDDLLKAEETKNPTRASSSSSSSAETNTFSFMFVLASLSAFVDTLKSNNESLVNIQNQFFVMLSYAVTNIDKFVKNQSIDHEFINSCCKTFSNIKEKVFGGNTSNDNNNNDHQSSSTKVQKIKSSFKENAHKLKIIIDKKFVTRSDKLFVTLFVLWMLFTSLQITTEMSKSHHHHEVHKEHFKNSMAEFTSMNGVDGGTGRQLMEMKRRKPNDNMNIPGTFLDDSLYVLGARITTSFVPTDNNVYFDLFANGYNNNVDDESSLLNYHEASQVPLYCYVDPDDSTNNDQKLIPMKLVPLKTFDSSDIEGTEQKDDILSSHTLIWRCDISNYVSNDITTVKKSSNSKIMVHVVTNSREQQKGNTPDQNKVLMQTIKSQHTNVMTVDLPTTKRSSSVGYGGPQIMSSKSSISPYYYSSNNKDDENNNKKLLYDQGHGVSMCVAGINESNKKYLLEFIQHHVNVGVSHIMIGVDDEYTSKLMNTTEDMLYDYIYNKHIVVLGGMHHNMNDEGDDKKKKVTSSEHDKTQQLKLRKLQFYQQCLYHSKSITEYMLILDVNEMWIPPSKEYVKGIVDKAQNYYVFKEPVPFKNNYYSIRNDTTTNNENVVSSIIWNKLMTAATINKESKEKEHIPATYSLPDVIRMITSTYDTPTNNNGRGCCTDWCFQTFNSYIVVNNKQDQQATTRSSSSGKVLPKSRRKLRFNKRDQDPNTNFIYQKTLLEEYNKRLTIETVENRKPIINTRYAHSTSLQLGGSCKVSTDKEEETSYNNQNPSCSWILDDTRNYMTGHVSYYKTLLAVNDNDDATTGNNNNNKQKKASTKYDDIINVNNPDFNNSPSMTIDDEYYKYYRRITLTQLKQRMLMKQQEQQSARGDNNKNSNKYAANVTIDNNFVIPDIDNDSDIINNKNRRWSLSTSMWIP